MRSCSGRYVVRPRHALFSAGLTYTELKNLKLGFLDLKKEGDEAKEGERGAEHSLDVAVKRRIIFRRVWCIEELREAIPAGTLPQLRERAARMNERLV